MDQRAAIVNNGDHHRLIRVMEKARQGGEVCVAFLGGSITEGYSSSRHENCYAARIFKWWQQSFPQAKMRYVNAGIGGTGSDYSTARAERDVLSEKPDVVFVDFSVNDAANGFYNQIKTFVSRQNIRIIHTFFFKNFCSS